MSGDTLVGRYERTMSHLQQIREAGYQVKVQWECEFDDTGIAKQKSELLTNLSPLYILDALYGGRTVAMRLHYKVRENETIQYVVISLYPYIRKFINFPLGHPVTDVCDACKDKEACQGMDGLIKCSIVRPQRLTIWSSFQMQQEAYILSV